MGLIMEWDEGRGLGGNRDKQTSSFFGVQISTFFSVFSILTPGLAHIDIYNQVSSFIFFQLVLNF